MRLRPSVIVATATTALLTAVVLPAGAHPAFTDGATAPAGSLVTLTLAMAHGCGAEGDEEGDPTTEVAVEVPDAVSYIEPVASEGYEVASEGEPGEVPDVVTWTATDGGIPAPEVAMDAVVDGEPGDEIHVRVVQSCDGDAYRWVGTPDEPAGDPAVRLTLAEPDPDAPPPPTEGASADGQEGEVAGGDEEADDTATPDSTETEGDSEAAAVTVEELPTEPPEDDGDRGLGWWPVVLGAVVLAGLGSLAGARRRRVLDPTAQDHPATPSDDA